MNTIVGFFTDWAKDQENNLWHKGTSVTPPSALYVGLSTAAPSRSGAVSEPPASSGYARTAVPATSWASSSSGSLSNTAAVTFAQATADWPTPVQTVFLATAPAGGNVIWMASLTTPRTVHATDTPKTIAVGAITVAK